MAKNQQESSQAAMTAINASGGANRLSVAARLLRKEGIAGACSGRGISSGGAREESAADVVRESMKGRVRKCCEGAGARERHVEDFADASRALRHDDEASNGASALGREHRRSG